jgi:hypothetical protein
VELRFFQNPGCRAQKRKELADLHMLTVHRAMRRAPRQSVGCIRQIRRAAAAAATACQQLAADPSSFQDCCSNYMRPFLTINTRQHP